MSSAPPQTSARQRHLDQEAVSPSPPWGTAVKPPSARPSETKRRDAPTSLPPARSGETPTLRFRVSFPITTEIRPFAIELSVRGAVRLPVALAACTIAFLLAGACSEDDPNPAAITKPQRLIEQWNLRAVEDLGEEDLEFSYTFAGDGRAINTMSGEFLTALRDIDDLDEEIVAELEKLQGIDGGDLEWRGTWTSLGDSLDIRFDSLTISLFGRIPVLGKISVPVYSQALEETEIVELGFRCSLTASELALQGRSLTAGVTPELGAVDQKHTDGLGSVGVEGVLLAGDRLLSLVRDSNLNEFVFIRD